MARLNRPAPDLPGPGQESVWDYPRPPAIRPCRASIQVVLGGATIADTTSSWQVLETSHPPTYYLPRASFMEGSLRPAEGASWCEWKGEASYFDLVGGGRVAERAAWTYLEPSARFADLAGAIALNAAAVDRCLVDDEVVEPQAGGFYGGWITSAVVGPFKGGPGTWGW